MAPVSETTRLWDQLLEHLEEGRVIPIVGQDLLTVRFEGRDVPLYRLLAERLAGGLEVSPADLDDTGALNTVACRYLAQGGELEDIYSVLKSVMPPPESLTTPEPLLQLAAIKPLRLFVSTTFDPLLERALNEVRFGGQARTQVLSYSPQTAADLPGAVTMEHPVVFQLLGRLSAVPDYAITDEDVLEFMHSLQSETRRPALLFDELNRRHLLIIGSSFSGWLARFFIRIAKRERLTQARVKTDIVADRHVQEDASLVYFLRHFSVRTKVFPGHAVEFVNELHQRWMERHPATADVPAPATHPRPSPLEMERGAVFLSYAREDRQAVEAMKDGLERAGIDAWFDITELEMGDPWQDKIRRNIENCSFFVPVISRHTLIPERRYFRVEWRHAEAVAMQVAPSMKFILPVVIDETTSAEPGLPGSFRDVQWTRLPQGNVTPEFAASMKQLYREYQKGQAGG